MHSAFSRFVSIVWVLRHQYSCIPLTVIKAKLIFKVTSCSVPAHMLGNYGNLISRQKATTREVPLTLFRDFRGSILEAMWVEKHVGGRLTALPGAEPQEGRGERRLTARPAPGVRTALARALPARKRPHPGSCLQEPG